MSYATNGGSTSRSNKDDNQDAILDSMLAELPNDEVDELPTSENAMQVSAAGTWRLGTDIPSLLTMP